MIFDRDISGNTYGFFKKNKSSKKSKVSARLKRKRKRKIARKSRKINRR